MKRNRRFKFLRRSLDHGQHHWHVQLVPYRGSPGGSLPAAHRLPSGSRVDVNAGGTEVLGRWHVSIAAPPYSPIIGALFRPRGLARMHRPTLSAGRRGSMVGIIVMITAATAAACTPPLRGG